jgi:Xaa-Pro aminopeptidase
MDPYAVDLAACRARQRRLLEAVEPLDVDLILLTRRESVQWLTGARIPEPFETIAAMNTAGRVTLALPDRQLETVAAVDERIGYEAKWHSTNRDEQRAASSEAIRPTIKRPKRVACEFETFSPYLCLEWNVPLVEVDGIIFDLRRRKDADELRMLARANEANRAMYEHGRQIVRPGVNELEIYSELQAVAVRTLGETLTYFGQDFQGGTKGGPPRNRQLESGEIIILDLGVGFRGYYSDNARAIAVGGEPTAAQQRAWQAVTEVFGMLQSTARPGVRCQDLYHTAHRHLNSFAPWSFNHHLGHGVGLAPHEGPHLNPRWDDTLAEGDFIAVEPGLYHEELRAGIRLEQNYVVTASGVQLLTDWPLEL